MSIISTSSNHRDGELCSHVTATRLYCCEEWILVEEKLATISTKRHSAKNFCGPICSAIFSHPLTKHFPTLPSRRSIAWPAPHYSHTLAGEAPKSC